MKFLSILAAAAAWVMTPAWSQGEFAEADRTVKIVVT